MKKINFKKYLLGILYICTSLFVFLLILIFPGKTNASISVSGWDTNLCYAGASGGVLTYYCNCSDYPYYVASGASANTSIPSGNAGSYIWCSAVSINGQYANKVNTEDKYVDLAYTSSGGTVYCQDHKFITGERTSGRVGLPGGTVSAYLSCSTMRAPNGDELRWGGSTYSLGWPGCWGCTYVQKYCSSPYLGIGVYGQGGSGGGSTPIHVTGYLQCNSPSEYSPVPSPPGGFNLYGSSSCSGTTNQTNSLSWTASSGVSYYNIYRDGYLVSQRTSTSYSETLSVGTHYYRVLAVNSGGSRYANQNPLYIYARDCSPPGVPNLTATPDCNGDQSVNKLAWTPVSGASNYYVYRCERRSGSGGHGGGSFNRCSRIASLGSSTTNYNDNVNFPSTYEYYIQAYKSSNNTSSYSSRQRVEAKCCTLIDIKYFRANPANIKRGQSTRLEWDTANATSLRITPDIGSVSIPSGQTGELFPTDPITYTLHATGVCSGDTKDAPVKVNVSQTVYRGIFIGDRIVIETDRDYLLRILYDPRTINMPPPGFEDILAPLIKEVAP